MLQHGPAATVNVSAVAVAAVMLGGATTSFSSKATALVGPTMRAISAEAAAAWSWDGGEAVAAMLAERPAVTKHSTAAIMMQAGGESVRATVKTVGRF